MGTGRGTHHGVEKGLDGFGGGAGAESLGEEVGGGVAEEGVFEVGEEEAARHGRRRPLTLFGAALVFSKLGRFGLFRESGRETTWTRTTHFSYVTSHYSILISTWHVKYIFY